ncbi:hypothetical protein B0A50_06104 [Salinomyces thailandicus]|uniref:Uncharacterized protein n=1 Tax=Salinomyces thailandicus TaxID=706561 RepID=A0A4U0TST4_9PEZI|nr:hypothetical protein B0A50_06104 [Salinomyces thailandica]
MELRRTAVCHECLTLLRRPRSRHSAAPALLAPLHYQSSTRRPISAKAHNERLRSHGKAHTAPAVRFASPVLDSLFLAARSANYTVSSQDLHTLHTRIVDLTDSALQSEGGALPEEQRVLYVLEQLEALAQTLIDGPTAESLKHASGKASDSKRPTAESMSATSALLGSVNTRSFPAFITKASLLNLISEKAEHILRHPTIFITPAILKAYVHLQTFLHQPASLPDIFHLYAHKSTPTAQANKAEPTLTPTNPDQINAAIPPATALLALDSAIQCHDLSLALALITTTFRAPAFKKAKILRQGLIPASGLAIAPLAAYTLSTHFGAWQSTMDPGYATSVAFAGILTYVAAVSSIGYVAITTANDQMDRVTWAPGVPLWERWIREEERAALDQVAGAWGFAAVERRGEEEGGEWERLREFVGVGGMVLDRVELMEGME